MVSFKIWSRFSPQVETVGKILQGDLITRRSTVSGSMKLRSKCCYFVRGFARQCWKTDIETIFGLIVVLSSIVATGVSQEQPTGFISIDCGGKGGKDPLTGLDWITDDGFLDSASNLLEEGFAIRAIVNLQDTKATSRDNAKQLETAMVFVPFVPDPLLLGSQSRPSRSKYCYKFNVTHDEDNPESTDYLVRVMFPNRDLTNPFTGTELNKFGTRFYLTVDSTFVATIDLDPVKPQTIELKVTPIDDRMYICLVPLEDRSSMAAISSLELRPLPVELYNRTESAESNVGSDTSSQTTYFMTISRLNFGGNESLPALRYPVDKYDRLWYPAPTPQEKSTDIVPRRLANAAVPLAARTQPPTEVLLTAWEGKNMSSEISFTLEVGRARDYRRLRRFVTTLLFLDINPGGTGDIRQVKITNRDTNFKSNKTLSGEFNVSTIVSKDRVSELHDGKLSLPHHLSTFSVKPDGNSTLPAMVNAVEVYGTFTALTQRTENSTTATIKEFLSSMEHNLDTTGDACLPVPWRWLVCSIEVPPRITQIDLSEAGVSGEITAEMRSLDRLTVLDLSDNGLYGSLPRSLADLLTLRTLKIVNTLLGGALPPFKEKSLVNLETLSLRNNAFNGSLVALVKAMDSPVSSIGGLPEIHRNKSQRLCISEGESLDLSKNKFEGSIPVDIRRLTSLRSLDLSVNELSGAVPIELVQLPELIDLSLQNNSFTGVVPDELWNSDSKLERVPTAPSIYIQRCFILRMSIFSCHNRVHVLRTKSFDENQPRVYLAGNKIRDIILPYASQDIINQLRRPPPIREIVWTQDMKPLRSRSGFILLGEDNPWCQSFQRATATLVQRYLCRSMDYEDFWEPRTVDSNLATRRTLIIVGVISGLLLLLMIFVLDIVLWRMWKRTRELRHIQEVLAKDDVRPPFFKYDELKAATRDFSKENELGKGAFGAVYKAVLSDGSTVAVKRLFSKDQNIADFLKEVVLITGIKHRNLIQLKGCCVRDRHRLLVYEYAENQNLAEALWGERRLLTLSWPQRLKICLGIARGLSYLHEELQPKIIHRDIKPQNILLDRDWNAKIADFGLARPANEEETQFATSVGGTLGYFSPEYATLGIFTEKLDVYSYGVLVLEIVSGRRCINLSLSEDAIYLKNWAFQLYKEDKILEIAEKGLLETGSRDEVLSVLKTALLCLQDNYDKRPSMSEVVNMLNGNLSNLAIDIVYELKDCERLYDGLIYGSTTTKWDWESSTGNEGHAFVHSSSSSNPQGAIELQVRSPDSS